MHPWIVQGLNAECFKATLANAKIHTDKQAPRVLLCKQLHKSLPFILVSQTKKELPKLERCVVEGFFFNSGSKLQAANPKMLS